MAFSLLKDCPVSSVSFSWDVRGTSITKSTVTECVKRVMVVYTRSFNGALLTVYLYMLYPIATFQKAGTCLDDHQSMAKQPIKSCVSNQSCTCGKA